MLTVYLDFETYFDPKCSLSSLTTVEYCSHELFKVWGVGMAVGESPAEWYGEDEVEDALNSVNWNDVNLVCHNTLFDGYVLADKYHIHPRFYSDTAAMARGLNPTLSAKLSEVAKRLFPDDETMRKGDELVSAKGHYDLDPSLEASIAGYCIQDVELTKAIFNKQVVNYPQSELELIDLTTRMFCQPSLEINVERLTEYKEQVIANTLSKIENSGTTREVLASNPKFCEYLKSLGITPPVKTSPNTGKKIPAFGKADAGWKQLVEMYPEHQNLWDARIAVKNRIDETRADRFLNSVNSHNQLPVPLRYYAAHTGRFGGTDKINMLNLPRGSELRKCLTSPISHYIYVMDLSNIEARMLALIAGQEDLLDAFANGEDVYCQFAEKIYGRPIQKNVDDDERFVGKTAVLGLGYGMGDKKFAMTIRTGAAGKAMPITDEEALSIVQLYRNSYVGITQYWKQANGMLYAMMDPNQIGNRIGPLTIDRHGLVLPNGMSLRYHNLSYNEHLNRFYFGEEGKITDTYGAKVVENIVQALSRIVITDAMLKLSEQLKVLKAHVAHTVHDEILVVGPKNHSDSIMRIMEETMTRTPDWANGLPLAVEGGFDVTYSK